MKTAKPAAARKTAAAKTPKVSKAKATAADTAAKAPRKPAAGKAPSAALAAVIGTEPVARPEAVKKIWEYIKAHKLQDAANKRNINADAKLKEIFKKPQVTMFEMTKLVNAHLS